MKRHTKIYLQGMSLDGYDFIPCEVCNSKAVDVHHIECRGAGGDPQGSKDNIDNLMALCRSCHITYGDKKMYKEFLKERHQLILNK